MQENSGDLGTKIFIPKQKNMCYTNHKSFVDDNILNPEDRGIFCFGRF